MAIAGHYSQQMLEHYSHIRMDLKGRPWTDSLAIAALRRADRVVTTQRTSQSQSMRLQVIGKNGRGERIRTSDPLVPNQVLYQAEPLPELAVGKNCLRAERVPG